MDPTAGFLAPALAALILVTGCSSSSSASATSGDAGSEDTGAGPTGPSDSSPVDVTSSDGTAVTVEAGPDGSHSGPPDAAGLDASDASAITVPAPAAGAGFKTIVFEDDFTTTDTIATSATAASGFKWYWSFDGNAQPWTVHTTATAASIANGNTGGGANASPHGGILTVSGPGEPNDALITVPGGALNNAHAALPAEGQGCWAHAYFEAYIQFKIDGNSSTDASTGWPAFWSWSVQGLKGFGFGSSSLSTANYSEIDFMETYGTIFGNTPGNWTATMHQWPANASSDGHTQHTDDQWHTYGCLWTSTGTGTGQVKFYLDGAQADQTVDSGTGQTQFSLEQMSQFIVLGTGKGWDMNVDWVRVWQ
jgi:hypothetical protein